MSVLTITGSALPDRTLPSNDYTHTPTFTSRSQLPFRSEAIPTSSYTRSAAATSTPGAANSHRHTRTISSALLPADPVVAKYSPSTRLSQNSPRSATISHSRQSSTSTMETMHMQRQGTNSSVTSGMPRRSTSSRSTGTNAPTSYVALMRKQKATVWCDRSQHTDQRLAAAQKVAKQRANLEVHGVTAVSARTSTLNSGGVVGKIRHGGVPKAPGYSPANMSGAGVPMRLSANEMLGDDETDGQSDNAMIHARSGSGKSSASSTKYRSGYPRTATSAEQNHFNTSRISTPPSGNEGMSPGREGIPELAEGDQTKPHHHQNSEQSEIPHKRTDSEDSFGDIHEMSAPNALQQATQKASNADDLKRRGSVDERAMSMGAGVRLFVANPDLDD